MFQDFKGVYGVFIMCVFHMSGEYGQLYNDSGPPAFSLGV